MSLLVPKRSTVRPQEIEDEDGEERVAYARLKLGVVPFLNRIGQYGVPCIEVLIHSLVMDLMPCRSRTSIAIRSSTPPSSTLPTPLDNARPHKGRLLESRLLRCPTWKCPSISLSVCRRLAFTSP